ncbi:ribosome assembly factor SBDS [Candidatus Woesearchaeota archaeon]|nr:ribosome assembly factor SBDS [Candidatus Woesearchaeota archaeon]
MVDTSKAVIARITSHGHHFEVLVDSENALAVRQGREMGMHDVLAVMEVFTDSRKGLEASPKAMEEAFGTTDAQEVALAIIKKGDIQLTQEHRQRIREQKMRQLINLLHINAVDAKTHLPHPMQRIEAALAEAKFHLDENKPVEAQLHDAIDRLRPIMPIRFEVKEMNVKISPQYTGKAYGVLKKFGPLLREEWQNNGYLHAVVEIPGGLETDFYEQLNAVCHGEVEVSVLKAK